MSSLNQLISISQKPSKRIGRGYGSGKGGHTSSRGTKGQLSRRGGKVPLWFEGGQLPLIKRLPMLRGKGRLQSLSNVAVIKVGQLNNVNTEVITVDSLKLVKLISSKAKKIKIIAGGRLSHSVEIRGIQVTDGARIVIERAGGRVVE